MKKAKTRREKEKTAEQQYAKITDFLVQGKGAALETAIAEWERESKVAKGRLSRGVQKEPE